MSEESSKAAQVPAAAQLDGKAVQPAPKSTPNPAPVPAIPPVPLKALTVRPQMEVVHRHMHGAVLTMEEPAQARFSSILTKRWGELAMEANLGTPRPKVAHVGLDDSKRFLYLAPSHKEDTLGLEVRYEKGSAAINLVKAFAPLQRYVAPGRRELYEVGITDGKVLFDDGFEAISLYVYLVPVKEEPRRTMSEESKAKLRATLARKKQQALAQQNEAGAD